nr:MAG TPA: hypothetical protein [Caudoviricetes sp.]
MAIIPIATASRRCCEKGIVTPLPVLRFRTIYAKRLCNFQGTRAIFARPPRAHPMRFFVPPCKYDISTPLYYIQYSLTLLA